MWQLIILSLYDFEIQTGHRALSYLLMLNFVTLFAIRSAHVSDSAFEHIRQ